LFLQVQQLETAELSLKISLRLCNIPQSKSLHNTSTSIQNKIFLDDNAQTIISWHAKKLVYKCKLASFFHTKLIVKINYSNAAFTSSASAKV